MAQHSEQNSIRRNSRNLLKEKLLSSFAYCSLSLFVSISFLSESVAATPGKTEPQMAQQPEATLQDANRVAAQRAFAEAEQLRQQGTVEPLRQAIEKYEDALRLWRAVGDHSQEAVTLNNIGRVYDSFGEKQKALDYLNQSLPLSRAVANKAHEASTMSNTGAVYDSLTQKQLALSYYNQLLRQMQAVGDKAGEADTLTNIGAVYDSLGQKQQALSYYNQALPLSRAVGDKEGEALTLNNIGAVYDSLGQKQQALSYYNQALPLSQVVGDKEGEARTLNNIGAVYDSLGEKQQALSYYNQALPLRRAVGDKAGEARTLNNIGAVYDSLGQKQLAISSYNQSLPLSRAVGDKAGEAVTLNNIGFVYDSLGQKQQALSYYNQALLLSRAVGDKAKEALTLYRIADTQRDQGELQDALTQMEASLEIIEYLRTQVASQELRASYFASVQDYYQLYIDLLMQLHKQQPSQGYDALALQASERARARSLLEILSEANADIRQGVDSNLLKQERTIGQQLDAFDQHRIELLSGNSTPEQAAQLETEISELLQQYREVQAQIRATSPSYAALTQPSPLTVAEIQQQVLDDDTMLLEYSLGEERSYLWAVTKTGITSYELPKRADIETAALAFRDALTVPTQRLRKAVVTQTRATLSQLLLAPVAQQLGNKRLLIVSDGALEYVPFAALTKPNPSGSSNSEQPLVISHEIVNLPSASTLAVLRQELNGRKPAPKKVAVLADPVFTSNDERLNKPQGTNDDAAIQQNDLDTLTLTRAASEAGITFDRLPFTRQEGDRILALVPAAERMQSFDFAASRAIATSPELSQYQIVHFATHGILNSVNPELSGVVLSLVDKNGSPENGFLRLHDIFNLNLPAELVVLSACDTGLGQEVKGEGLVGLTRGFMYAGAPRVMVSLWSVDDEGTSELMTRFYKKMLQDGLKPATALRAAQIEMSQEQQWQAPYYWAAFVLQGEWR